MLELWGYASDIDECAKLAHSWAYSSRVGKSIFSRVSGPSQNWKMTVHTWGTKYDREEQDAMRKKFSNLGFEGVVTMKDFDNEYILIREVEVGPVLVAHPLSCLVCEVVLVWVHSGRLVHREVLE